MKHGLFAELKRRHVYRVAIAYAVVGWLVIQLASTVLPTFGAPAWVLKTAIGLIVIGFPVALVLAWAFEMTPEGVRRTEPADSPEAREFEQHRKIGHTLDRIIICVLVVAVAIMAWRLWLPHKHAVKQSPIAAPVSSKAPTIASVQASPAAAIPDKSIAVLPLANDSGDKKQQYFSDGLSENLIIALSQIPGLKVIGRDSSFHFRNSKLSAAAIGSKLGVAHLLEGSVQHAGDEVRISAELINASDGTTLWAQHYNRPYKNLFALQDTITNAVADALRAKLLPDLQAQEQNDRPLSGNLKAYKAYLQGKFYTARISKEGLPNAISKLEQATRLDPKYAQAWALLSWARSQYAAKIMFHGDIQSVYAKARVEAQRALSLAPDLAEAHIALGYVRQYSELDWKGAMTQYHRAAQLAPKNAKAKSSIAEILGAFGQLDRAIALVREALHTDPMSADLHYYLGTYLMAEGHMNAAETELRTALSLQPTDSYPRIWLVYLDIQRGDAAKALVEAKKVSNSAGWQDVAIATALQVGPNQSAANIALKKVIKRDANSGAYQIAQIYALRNDAEHTFAWLDRAITNRDPGFEFLYVDPFLRRFEKDPRFAAICRKIGLPTPRAVRANSTPKQSKHSKSNRSRTYTLGRKQPLGAYRSATG